MRKIKTIFISILAMTVLFTLASCGGSDNQTTSNQTEKYELIINTHDNAGNEITQTFYKIPTRVICNNLSSAKTMIDDEAEPHTRLFIYELGSVYFYQKL